MYSNDTNKLEESLNREIKKNKDLQKIFNNIQKYLDSKKIKDSLNIIYRLIRDNYCNIFQSSLLNYTKHTLETRNINTDSFSKDLNNKLNNIIFLSKEDRQLIQKTLPLLSIINASYKSNKIKLHIVSREEDELKEETLRRIISKLFVLIDLFTKQENTTYNLYIWLSDLKKQKPNKDLKNLYSKEADKEANKETDKDLKIQKSVHSHISKKTFQSKHINSGATVHNLLEETVELFIWRKEEIEKVLLHELIHTLKLDFMGYPENLKEDIIKQFNIPSSTELRLGEAYVETWAMLLNTIYVSFTQTFQKRFNKANSNKDLKNLNSKNINSKRFFKLLAMEIFFTLFQSSKILRHFGYECVTGCKVPFRKSNDSMKDGENELFEQETSVFSYYLIKSGILMNLGDFFKFCCKNNEQLLQFIESPINYQNLHKIFIESSKKNKLLNNMTKLNLNYDADENDILNNTMRMTLYELKL